MKVKGLDGKISVLDIRQSQHPLKSRSACKSNIQYECGQLLRKAFPSDVILEEVPIPKAKLFIDLLLPARRIAVEVMGKQHAEYIPHFHKSEKGFKESLNRDSLKRKWCEINEITLYEVKSIEEMKELLGV